MECKENATDSKIIYTPTKAEESLLDIMLSPENRMKSVADICKLAKVDRATYYRAFQKPEFVEIYNKRSVDLVKQSVASVLNTFVREAQRGSFQHGKVLLEMAGVYTEKSDVNVSGTLETSTAKLDSILEQLKD
ncbi:MAG: phBC6A51 family helix-turn-helix protein [Ruminiclostridium sp.]